MRCGTARPAASANSVHARPAASADSIQQPVADFFPAPTRQSMRAARHAPAPSDGERLEFSARRENFGIDVELGGARIDDLAQAFDQRFLLGRGARILTGFL